MFAVGGISEDDAGKTVLDNNERGGRPRLPHTLYLLIRAIRPHPRMRSSKARSTLSSNDVAAMRPGCGKKTLAVDGRQL